MESDIKNDILKTEEIRNSKALDIDVLDAASQEVEMLTGMVSMACTANEKSEHAGFYQNLLIITKSLQNKIFNLSIKN